MCGGALLAVAMLSSLATAQAAQNQASGNAAMSAPKGKAFASPAKAAASLYAAAHRNDEQELLAIIGPDGKEIIMWNEDPNERHEQRQYFVEKYRQVHRLVREPDETVALYVGSENWPFPIPLVEYKGAWYFDGGLGTQEVRYRRIGRNEMEALGVCHSLVDAEKEYRAEQHSYTEKFVSDSGTRDGLYWKSADNSADKSKLSPIGPYLAHAGVLAAGSEALQPYHGYYYRVLLQGAGGGANANGFVVLAFPADYRSSGVMTFATDQDGMAYEKDLGEQTATQAKQLTGFHPDSSWKKVE